MKKEKQKKIELNENEYMDAFTGEVKTLSKDLLNKVIVHEEMRPNGTLRIRYDYSNCPTMAEQHTAHLTDLNYLMETYTPDELAQYIAAKNARRSEIINHDFSVEPSMQEGLNEVYRIRSAFERLDDDVKRHFKNHLEFVKFIDNPANAEKMLKLGLLTPQEITDNSTNVTPPTTKEETKEQQVK